MSASARYVAALLLCGAGIGGPIGCVPPSPTTSSGSSGSVPSDARGDAAALACPALAQADPCTWKSTERRTSCRLQRPADEGCCTAPAAAVIASDCPGVGALAGCVAGLRIELMPPCRCIRVCDNDACSENHIPAFRVRLTNCGDQPQWVNAYPGTRVFMAVVNAETGWWYVGGEPRYVPAVAAWTLEGLLPLGARSFVELNVPLWQSATAVDDTGAEVVVQDGPPPSGWYRIRAVLYVPERRYFDGWPDSIWVVDDGSERAQCVLEVLGEDARPVPGDEWGPQDPPLFEFRRSGLARLAGFDCVWPFCGADVDRALEAGAISSDEEIVYIDAGAWLPDPRLLRRPRQGDRPCPDDAAPQPADPALRPAQPPSEPSLEGSATTGVSAARPSAGRDGTTG